MFQSFLVGNFSPQNVTGLSTSVLTCETQPYTIMKFLLTLDAKFKLSTIIHDKIHDCRGEVVTHVIKR